MRFSFNMQTLSIIAQEFSKLLNQDVAPETVHTSTLLKNDCCFGRKFQVDNIVAIWKNSQPEIEFYDAQDGTLLSTLNLTNDWRLFAA